MNFVIPIVVTAIVFAMAMILRQAMPSMIPPPRIHLVPVRKIGRYGRDVEVRARQIEACGFHRLGAYKVEPVRGLYLTAFAHPGESLCAVVYTHAIAGSFVDMIAKSESGRTFTATTATMGQQLDQREGHEKVFDTTLTMPAMYELVLRRRPPGPWEQWTTANFVTKFEDAYAKEMDWRASRGGVTPDEVRRFAQSSGRKMSEGDILRTTRRLQRRYMDSRRSAR